MERGAQEVFRRLQREIKAFGLEEEVPVTMVGDVGRHDAAPMVIVYPEAVIYGPISPEDVHFLVEEHLYKGVSPPDYRRPRASCRDASPGCRRARARCRRAARRSGTGRLDRPGGHRGLHRQRRLRSAGQGADRNEAGRRDQRDRQGRSQRAGRRRISTGMKWRFVSQVDNYPRYIICNADESERGRSRTA